MRDVHATNEAVLNEMMAVLLPKNKEQADAELAKLRRENAELRRKLQTGFHFTKEEMIEHDKLQAQISVQANRTATIDKARKVMKQEYDEALEVWKQETDDFWEECRKTFNAGSEDENFMAWCRVMWAIPIEVLIEVFHWKPITEDCCCDNRQAIVKFANQCAARALKLQKDQNKDIRTACKEIVEKYGVEFALRDSEEDEDD